MSIVLAVLLPILVSLWYLHFYWLTEKINRLEFRLRLEENSVRMYKKEIANISELNRKMMENSKPELTKDDFWKELSN